MEAFFGGVDLSAVRVHIGPQPAAIGALAFASGSSIYFLPDAYCPGNPRSMAMLVHELTHVLQQRAGWVASPDPGMVIEDPALEAQAQRMAVRFLHGVQALMSSEFPGASLDRIAGDTGEPRAGDGRPGAVQPIVNLGQLHPMVDPNKLAGCARIQRLLQDDAEVLNYLTQLEQEVRQCTAVGKYGEDTATARLSKVLADTEHQWMRPGVAKLPATAGVVEVTNLLVDHLWQRRALKDIGAGPQHGEYSHRIQWYIIYHYFRSNGVWNQHIRDLYDVIVNPLNAATNIVGVRVSLWDSVLDVRDSWRKGMHNRVKVDGLQEIYGDARYASPVFLNESLTSDNPGAWGGVALQNACPRLRLALTSRREKRKRKGEGGLSQWERFNRLQQDVEGGLTDYDGDNGSVLGLLQQMKYE